MTWGLHQGQRNPLKIFYQLYNHYWKMFSTIQWGLFDHSVTKSKLTQKNPNRRTDSEKGFKNLCLLKTSKNVEKIWKHRQDEQQTNKIL